jgi:hypothetical protein
MSELDLTGKPPKTPKAAPAKARPSGAQQRRQAGTRLEARLEEVFERIGTSLVNRREYEQRSDLPFNEELGVAIIEDRALMAGGLVNLTRRVKPLRPPLLMALEAMEPLLAFGRVIGIALRRARQARQDALDQAAEYEAQQQAEYADNGAGAAEPATALDY